ncbi:MAG: C2H2-type zinc finger protein, partial [Gammaproteobacteria bacterium]|nr:C2H2-type zinc finger protein [Gammaproteobacteria bacterium]
MNPEERGIQPDSWGEFEEKFDTTPDSKELQVHSFFDNCTLSNNSKSRLKEEKDDTEDYSIPIRSLFSTCQDAPSVEAGEPDRDNNVPEQGSSRLSKATISKQVQYAKNAQRHNIGAKVQIMVGHEICARNFTRSDNLKIHQQVHNGLRPFSCKACSKSFKQSDDLNRHILVHTSERPFNCEVCSKSFKKSGTLAIHLRTHTGEKPFNREGCTRSIKHSSQLNEHLQVHMGQRSFECEMCSKSFNFYGDLKRHIRVHTDDRRFNCQVCLK